MLANIDGVDLVGNSYVDEESYLAMMLRQLALKLMLIFLNRRFPRSCILKVRDDIIGYDSERFAAQSP